MTNSIDGKVVVITGGARGIGLATATLLHKLGAKVAIGDVDEITLKASAGKLGLTTYGRLDVTDSTSFSDFLDRVERELGPIDVLVNNAGIMPTGRIVDETDKVTERILDINVLGVINGSKLAARRMVPRGSGHVINISSLAGETYAPGLATYCASKWAVIGFTDSARLEYRTSGVKFSIVMPPFVNTELTAGTHGIKGFKNVEPEVIAQAVAGLIVNPKPRVRPGLMGKVTAIQRFLPRSVNEAVNRLVGGETVMVDVDVEARSAYEARARGEK